MANFEQFITGSSKSGDDFSQTVSKLIRSIGSQAPSNDSKVKPAVNNTPPIPETKDWSYSRSLSAEETTPIPETLPNDSNTFDNGSNMGKKVLKENGPLAKTLSLEAAEELSKRPKTGKMYTTLLANVEVIYRNLKELAMRERHDSAQDFIDMGLEIADAASLLKILGKSTNEIELAGQKAHRSAILLQEGLTLYHDAGVLLGESISILRSMNFEQ